jgi:hypothetical protein
MAERIVYGINSPKANLAGMKIFQVKRKYSSVFGIAPDAVAMANQEKVSDDYVVQPGDEIEFVKPAGEKALVFSIGSL